MVDMYFLEIWPWVALGFAMVVLFAIWVREFVFAIISAVVGVVVVVVLAVLAFVAGLIFGD